MRRKFLLKVMILSLLFVAMGGGYLYSQDGVTPVTTEEQLAAALAAGGFIKDQSGIDNYSQINVSNSTLTLTNVSRGFTGAKVTLNDVDLTITGGEHGINGSELVIKNGSNVSISNGTGRAITLNKFDASIAGSNVTISNMDEGGIRYKTANTLTVDASSTLSETTAHADVDNAKLNDKVVRGTESQMSTVKVEGGETTVINPVSGQVAYRAYIEDSESREAVKVDLQNVNALSSLAVKLYDANGNLLTTTTYRAGAVERPGYLTCNIVLWGEASSSWGTTIHADELTVENIPYKIELVVDDNVIHAFDNALGAGTSTDETAKYIALDCVLDIPVAKVGNKEYYTIDKAVANWTNNTTLTLLANVTLSKAIEIKSEETHTLDLGTFTMTAAEGYNAIEIMPATNRYGKFTINADATNPGGITANGKNCIHYNNTTSNDLPTITINGGVFNGNYSIYCNKTKTPRGDSPKVVVNNGTFNGIVKVTYGALYVYDGYFDAEVTCTGADDGHGQRLIVGGTFKKWGFMTADAPNKFTVGRTWGTYDVGVYVDDNGYLVVGGDVVTEPGETFEASSANYGGWSTYLKYSSAAANNLYYTSVEQAFADNTSSNSSVNIFTDELDLTQLTYNGTIVIADDFTVTFAEGNEPTIIAAEGLDLGYTQTVENGIVTRVYSVGNFVAAIGTAKYATLADAIAAAKAGQTIDLLDNYNETLSEVLLIDKSLTINGNGKTLTSSATRVIRLTALEIEVTINNLNMVSTAVRVGTNDIRGISIDIIDNVTLTLNNCSVDFTDASANDWAYAVNVTGGNEHNVTVNGGTYEGANVINVRGASNTIVVNDATLNCTYPNNDMYYGACIWVLEENGSSVEATGNTFNGGNAVAFNLGTGTDLTESNNTDNTTKVIAKIGNELYVSLQEAINAATENATIVVLHNIELTQGVVVAADKTFTLDLNGKTITGTPTEAAAFAVIKNSGNLTITDDTEAKDGKILCNHNLAPSTGYAVNTITNNGTLTVVAGTIENKSTYTSSNQIGYAIDNYSGAAVVIKGGKVTASGSSYYDGIRQFCNSETLENSVTIEGGEVSTLWIQNPSNDNEKDVKGSFAITGGTLNSLYLEPSANFSGSISGGHVGSISRHQSGDNDIVSFITGGTFGMDVTEFSAFNYVCTSNGNGTYGIEYKPQEEDAFVIETLHELEAFRDAVNAGNDFEGQTVVLSAGVNLNPTRAINIWEPIGTQANPFRGTFDGGDNTISNLVVVGENNVGLFGYADNATIKNVKLENVNVKGTDCVGAIAGQVYSTSLIDNCHVSGSIQVEGQTNVGGIVGKYYTKVTNSSVIGDGVATSYVKGVHYAADYEGDNIGGIMGHGGENNTFTNNTVKNITISGTRKVGGIVGVTDQNTDVTNCFVENVNIETTAKAEYAQANAAKAGHASIVGSYTKLGANNNGTVTNCVVKNVTFVNNDNVTMSAGPITGGAREGMVDPTGVTASGNLVYMSTITGNTTNMYLMHAVAQIDENKYYTLQDAVDAGDGETINVILSTTEDINIADGATITLTFADDVTLNGYIAPFNGNLTVNGGTINNTNSGKSAIEINAGNLELNNVNISSARHALRLEGINGEVNATINGGTYKAAQGTGTGTYHAINAGGDGSQVTVTITDGTFVGPKGTTADSGSAVNVQSGATVTIEGGDFSKGKNATLGVSGTMIVKGGKFDQDVTAYCANGYVCQMNADNKYEVFFAVASITNANGTLYYASLQAAVNAAGQNETTIVMIADAEVSETVRVEAGQKITLDLNGKTIDGTEKVRIALMSYGDLTIKDSTEEKNGMIKAGIGTAGNTVNICKGTFTLESGNIYSKNNAILIDEQTATVNINGGTITAEPTTNNSAAFYISSTSDTEVNITAGTMKGFNGILLWNNTKINITGGSVIAEGDLAIQGNGSRDNTEINISGENTIITGKDAAIYHPQGGKLNISGGTITGETGIVVKGGVVTISGGTINGTGEAVAYEPVSSGYKGTGDALYVEHYDNSTDSGNYGTPVVTVTGGTFNSTNAHPIASYANPNNASNGVEALANFISGGAFNKEVEESLLAVGYALTENNGMYEVSFADYIVLPSFMNENNYEDYFGTNTVTDGTNYYATLQVAVESVVGTESTLYCKPGANVGSLQHAPVTSTLTVYGNDAYVSGGAERDFDLGNTDPNGPGQGQSITADMTLTVKHLDGCGAWGTKSTEHTVNLVFENCDNMGKIFITGQTGILNITMTDCAFEGVIAEALYSNADGNITLTNVDFSNLNKAINLNHKASGTQTVTMTGCTFTDCGNDVSADQIPVRVLSSVAGGKSELTVENCTFTDTPTGGADILLDYGVGLTEAFVKGTNGTVVVERTENVAESHPVVAANEYSFNNLPFVAQVGDEKFTSLQAAINAADGKTVVVLDNITLTETVTVAAGTTVTLDLNGKTVSQTKEQTTGYQMILNDGNLTIVDNTNEKLGKISYTDSGNGGEYVSNTITNRGTITVKSGTIENLSSQTVAQNGYPYAIDSSIWGDASEVNTIVEGGKVHGATYSAIRLRADSTSEPVNVTVSGGEIVGTIEVQVPSSTVAGKGALVISGGKLSNSGTSNVLFFFGSGASAENIEVSVTGGEFTGNITISSSYPIGDNFNKNFITGGTFSTDVNDYCHEYYAAIQGDDNLWRVEQVLFAQTTELQAGWNWYSSYVDIDGATGLSLIQSALGSNGVQIKNPETGRFSQYSVNPNTLEAIWSGSLRETSSSDIYAIRTLGGEEITHNIEIVSAKLDPADPSNTVTIRRGWNYVAYPLDVQLSINAALGFTPTDGDVIKSKDQSSIYFGTWVGQLTNMIPGQGYMYQSNNSSIMEFNFEYPSTNNRESTVLNIEAIDYYWNVDAHNYSGNMTMIAMLETNDEIMQDGYEIAAFANGECRGTARPVYVESVDAYILVFTVNGEDVEELSFKCYDVNTGVEYNLNNRINYSNDAVVGSIDEPYMFNLDMLNIGETSVENISIYPNPTTTGREIQLQAVCDKVEVFNALGVKIAEYSNVDSIGAIETAGVYVIRLTIDNSARNCRLIVK